MNIYIYRERERETKVVNPFPLQAPALLPRQSVVLDLCYNQWFSFDLTVNSVESDAFSSFKQQVTLSKKLSSYILDIAIHLHRFFDNLIFADPLHCAPLMFVIFFISG